MRDLIDEFTVAWSEFFQKHSRIFDSVTTLIRWILLIVVPFIFGIYSSVILEEYIKGELAISFESVFSKESLLQLIPITILTALTVIGQVWRVDSAKRYLRARLIYNALRWLYIDLGFENNVDADVRCTIWTPKNSNLPAEKLRIVQFVNYVPLFGRASKDLNNLRMNKYSGRIRAVARLENGDVKPIGIVGKCAVESIRDHKPYIMYEIIGDDVDFAERMMRFWNFSKADVKRLTNDRKSYMSIALMNTGQTDLLGIIFMDSRLPNTFTKRIAKKAQRYLPEIAEMLTD